MDSSSTHHQKQKLYQILMLPWLGHGHVSPFLELAKRLVAMKNKNFQVFMCSTPANLAPFKQKSTADNDDNLIQFIDLHLPSSSELPPDQHTTKNLPPHLMPVLKTAFDEAKDNFHGILRELKPDILIYDFIQPWAALVAQQESTPAVLFLTTSAASSAFIYHSAEFDDDYPIPGLEFVANPRGELLKFLYDVSNGLTNKERYFQCIGSSCGIILIKTLNEIEKNHIDYLSRLVRKDIVPVGPLVQGPENKSSDESFLKWLDQRKDSKAVFVSFGTEYFLSKEEIEEVAYGLELSNVSFIWVLRFPGSANVPREPGKLYRKEDVARVIREVVAEEKGDKVRKKVEEMSRTIKEKGDQVIDNAVEKLVQLVEDKP
ncbi:OLC1v1007625C1 [Oldenlandia corymbosa var. corymbosa]|uniref:OLC1v1007625C1 n=1 Tax=Oldenlandia corymbosa var. corymbosa TaxID=529605 RepID=A0AAV1DMG3_OLDCO|nr:OLC1v1007625C1 [Oldenlandia corymbosa var. corymbosa]